MKRWGLAVAFLVAAGTTTAVAQIAPDVQSRCFAAGENNWRSCQVTCMAACQSSRLDVRSTAEACERLAATANRTDAPSCKTLAGATGPRLQNPVAEKKESQTIEACLTKAGAGPSLLERVGRIQTQALRESITKRLSDPAPPSSTDCAPIPAALTLMYNCIVAEADDIKKGYENIQGRTGAATKADRCSNGFGESDRTYELLAGLKARADYISTYSETKLLTCSTRWSTWLADKSKKPQSDSEPPDATTAVVATALDQLFKDLNEELTQVVTAKTKAEATIRNVNTSLANVEANAITVLLGCN